MTRAVSPALFAGIVLAFGLPFATVSCNGGTVRTTGIELATFRVPDAVPPARTDEGVPLGEAVERRESIFALATLTAAFAGLVCGLSRRRGEVKAAAAGAVGVLAMWAASVQVLGAEVEYEIGFVLVSAGFALLLVWHSALAVARRRRARLAGDPSSAAT